MWIMTGCGVRSWWKEEQTEFGVSRDEGKCPKKEKDRERDRNGQSKWETKKKWGYYLMMEIWRGNRKTKI